MTNAKQHNRQETILAYILILPVLLLVLILFLYPTLFNFYIAVHEWNWSIPLDVPKPFIGFENFSNLFTSSRFWNSFKISLLFVVFALVIEYFLGLALALTLNREFKGRGIFRAIFILPMMLAPIIIGIQWRYLLSGNFGALNSLIELFGVQGPLWLSDPKWGLPILIAVDTWTYAPFVALIILAGLQQIPQDLYDAAKVDGATPIKQFLYITFPFLKPATALVLLLRAGEIFRAFDVVYVMTGGGPVRTTEVLGLYLYKIAFVQGDLGLAAAIGLIIAAVGMILGTLIANLIRTEVRLF